MKKIKEKKKCEKCGNFLYCDEHHILPKGIFGNGETIALCKTCHDEYHRFLGFEYLRKKNAQPKEFYIAKWKQWISLIVIASVLLLLTF